MQEIRPVITVILRKDSRILIVKRSNRVSTFKNHWSGISGGISEGETPIHAAIRELEEETGIRAKKSDLMPLRKTIRTEGGKIIWEVYPFLLDISNESVSLDWENEKYEWIEPSELHRFEIVPKLDAVIDSLLRAFPKKAKS